MEGKRATIAAQLAQLRDETKGGPAGGMKRTNSMAPGRLGPHVGQSSSRRLDTMSVTGVGVAGSDRALPRPSSEAQLKPLKRAPSIRKAPSGKNVKPGSLVEVIEVQEESDTPRAHQAANESRAARRRAALLNSRMPHVADCMQVAGHRRSNRGGGTGPSRRLDDILEDIVWLQAINESWRRRPDAATAAVDAAGDVMVKIQDAKARVATSYNPGYVQKELSELRGEAAKVAADAYEAMILRASTTLPSIQTKFVDLDHINHSAGAPDDDATHLLSQIAASLRAAEDALARREADSTNSYDLVDAFIGATLQTWLLLRRVGLSMLARRDVELTEAEETVHTAEQAYTAVRNAVIDLAGLPSEVAEVVRGADAAAAEVEALHTSMMDNPEEPQLVEDFLRASTKLSNKLLAATTAVRNHYRKAVSDWLQVIEDSHSRLGSLEDIANASPDEQGLKLLRAVKTAMAAADEARLDQDSHPSDNEFRDRLITSAGNLKNAVSALDAWAARNLTRDCSEKIHELERRAEDLAALQAAISHLPSEKAAQFEDGVAACTAARDAARAAAQDWQEAKPGLVASANSLRASCDTLDAKLADLRAQLQAIVGPWLDSIWDKFDAQEDRLAALKSHEKSSRSGGRDSAFEAVFQATSKWEHVERMGSAVGPHRSVQDVDLAAAVEFAVAFDDYMAAAQHADELLRARLEAALKKAYNDYLHLQEQVNTAPVKTPEAELLKAEADTALANAHKAWSRATSAADAKFPAAVVSFLHAVQAAKAPVQNLLLMAKEHIQALCKQLEHSKDTLTTLSVGDALEALPGMDEEDPATIAVRNSVNAAMAQLEAAVKLQEQVLASDAPNAAAIAEAEEQFAAAVAEVERSSARAAALVGDYWKGCLTTARDGVVADASRVQNMQRILTALDLDGSGDTAAVGLQHAHDKLHRMSETPPPADDPAAVAAFMRQVNHMHSDVKDLEGPTQDLVLSTATGILDEATTQLQTLLDANEADGNPADATTNAIRLAEAEVAAARAAVDKLRASPLDLRCVNAAASAFAPMKDSLKRAHALLAERRQPIARPVAVDNSEYLAAVSALGAARGKAIDLVAQNNADGNPADGATDAIVACQALLDTAEATAEALRSAPHDAAGLAQLQSDIAKAVQAVATAGAALEARRQHGAKDARAFKSSQRAADAVLSQFAAVKARELATHVDDAAFAAVVAAEPAIAALARAASIHDAAALVAVAQQSVTAADAAVTKREQQLALDSMSDLATARAELAQLQKENAADKEPEDTATVCINLAAQFITDAEAAAAEVREHMDDVPRISRLLAALKPVKSTLKDAKKAMAARHSGNMDKSSWDGAIAKAKRDVGNARNKWRRLQLAAGDTPPPSQKALLDTCGMLLDAAQDAIAQCDLAPTAATVHAVSTAAGRAVIAIEALEASVTGNASPTGESAAERGTGADDDDGEVESKTSPTKSGNASGTANSSRIGMAMAVGALAAAQRRLEQLEKANANDGTPNDTATMALGHAQEAWATARALEQYNREPSEQEIQELIARTADATTAVGVAASAFVLRDVKALRRVQLQSATETCTAAFVRLLRTLIELKVRSKSASSSPTPSTDVGNGLPTTAELANAASAIAVASRWALKVQRHLSKLEPEVPFHLLSRQDGLLGAVTVFAGLVSAARGATRKLMGRRRSMQHVYTDEADVTAETQLLLDLAAARVKLVAWLSSPAARPATLKPIESVLAAWRRETTCTALTTVETIHVLWSAGAKSLRDVFMQLGPAVVDSINQMCSLPVGAPLESHASRPADVLARLDGVRGQLQATLGEFEQVISNVGSEALASGVVPDIAKTVQYVKDLQSAAAWLEQGVSASDTVRRATSKADGSVSPSRQQALADAGSADVVNTPVWEVIECLVSQLDALSRALVHGTANTKECILQHLGQQEEVQRDLRMLRDAAAAALDKIAADLTELNAKPRSTSAGSDINRALGMASETGLEAQRTLQDYDSLPMATLPAAVGLVGKVADADGWVAASAAAIERAGDSRAGNLYGREVALAARMLIALAPVLHRQRLLVAELEEEVVRPTQSAQKYSNTRSMGLLQATKTLTVAATDAYAKAASTFSTLAHVAQSGLELMDVAAATSAVTKVRLLLSALQELALATRTALGIEGVSSQLASICAKLRLARTRLEQYMCDYGTLCVKYPHRMLPRLMSNVDCQFSAAERAVHAADANLVVVLGAAGEDRKRGRGRDPAASGGNELAKFALSVGLAVSWVDSVADSVGRLIPIGALTELGGVYPAVALEDRPIPDWAAWLPTGTQCMLFSGERASQSQFLAIVPINLRGAGIQLSRTMQCLDIDTGPRSLKPEFADLEMQLKHSSSRFRATVARIRLTHMSKLRTSVGRNLHKFLGNTVNALSAANEARPKTFQQRKHLTADKLKHFMWAVCRATIGVAQVDRETDRVAERTRPVKGPLSPKAKSPTSLSPLRQRPSKRELSGYA